MSINFLHWNGPHKKVIQFSLKCLFTATVAVNLQLADFVMKNCCLTTFFILDILKQKY